MKDCPIKNLTGTFLVFPFILLLITSVPAHGQVDVVHDSISKAFYDTLRVRAEKRRLTNLLYDMIIVTPPSGDAARRNMRSTSPFEKYEGMVIRNREVIRLNAFGTDIDNPQDTVFTRTEKRLNSTYTKTHRFVLNGYLLFHQGDTVSALKFSDNERLLRQLPYIDDARITLIPVDDHTVDVVVVIRENYPVGFGLRLDDISKGLVKVFDKNFGGFGHDLEISVPYSFREYSYPALGVQYTLRNVFRTFSDLNFEFSDGMGSTNSGVTFNRGFTTSETKYAWNASLKVTYTTEDLDTMPVPVPLRFTWQDYWLSRSVMLDRGSVTRLIVTGRYQHNNVFSRPEIDDFSYYRLQRYRLITGSLAITSQRFINTSLIYSYGRTEDIPYGYMIELTGGGEINEFKWRKYAGINVAYGNIFSRIGYIYGGLSVSTFYNSGHTEQGMINARVRYFTPLIQSGRSRIRTFINLSYTRGFNRYTDEYLYLRSNDFVRGFRNDSIAGNSRITTSIEPVLFTYKPLIGFRFSFFTFADAGFLIKGGLRSGEHVNVTAIGAGIRVRNDQLVFNTIQLRFAFYPGVPPWSETSPVNLDGLVRLKPPDFEPDPPGVVIYR